jgi:hypothetical protein
MANCLIELWRRALGATDDVDANAVDREFFFGFLIGHVPLRTLAFLHTVHKFSKWGTFVEDGFSHIRFSYGN